MFKIGYQRGKFRIIKNGWRGYRSTH